ADEDKNQDELVNIVDDSKRGPDNTSELHAVNQEAERCYAELKNWNNANMTYTRPSRLCNSNATVPVIFGYMHDTFGGNENLHSSLTRKRHRRQFKWHAMVKGSPGRAWYSPATYVNNRIYCFGITNTRNEDDIPTSMDVHIFDCSTYSWSISHHHENANIAHFPQWGYSADNLGENIYIWGGCYNGSSCNNLYLYNTESDSWLKPVVSGSQPPAGWQHSSCIINNCIYTFAGSGTTDVHRLDLHSLSWCRLQTSGQPPTPRVYHTAVIINQIMYVWGGCKPLSPTSEELNPDIYAFDTINNIWSSIKCTKNTPISRRGHSAFVYKNEMYIFGGWSHVRNTNLNDLHVYNPSTKKWREIKPLFTGPKPLEGHVSLVVGTKLFVVGGADRYVGTRGPIWILNMT
ncbi:unnamed protein product, partial [Meganyctiphanes norvegica]